MAHSSASKREHAQEPSGATPDPKQARISATADLLLSGGDTPVQVPTAGGQGSEVAQQQLPPFPFATTPQDPRENEKLISAMRDMITMQQTALEQNRIFMETMTANFQQALAVAHPQGPSTGPTSTAPEVDAEMPAPAGEGSAAASSLLQTGRTQELLTATLASALSSFPSPVHTGSAVTSSDFRVFRAGPSVPSSQALRLAKKLC